MKSNRKSVNKAQARPAHHTSNPTIRGLADEFGQSRIDPSFSSGDAKGHLRYPMGWRRVCARTLQDLVNFTGDLTAQEMTVESGSRFLAYYGELRRRDGKALSPSTLRKVAAIVGAVFRHGIDRGACHVNPFEGIQVARARGLKANSR